MNNLTTSYEPSTSPNRLVPVYLQAVNGTVQYFNKAGAQCLNFTSYSGAFASLYF